MSHGHHGQHQADAHGQARRHSKAASASVGLEPAAHGSQSRKLTSHTNKFVVQEVHHTGGLSIMGARTGEEVEAHPTVARATANKQPVALQEGPPAMSTQVLLGRAPTRPSLPASSGRRGSGDAATGETGAGVGELGSASSKPALPGGPSAARASTVQVDPRSKPMLSSLQRTLDSLEKDKERHERLMEKFKIVTKVNTAASAFRAVLSLHPHNHEQSHEHEPNEVAVEAAASGDQAQDEDRGLRTLSAKEGAAGNEEQQSNAAGTSGEPLDSLACTNSSSGQQERTAACDPEASPSRRAAGNVSAGQRSHVVLQRDHAAQGGEAVPHEASGSNLGGGAAEESGGEEPVEGDGSVPPGNIVSATGPEGQSSDRGDHPPNKGAGDTGDSQFQEVNETSPDGDLVKKGTLSKDDLGPVPAAEGGDRSEPSSPHKDRAQSHSSRSKSHKRVEEDDDEGDPCAHHATDDQIDRFLEELFEIFCESKDNRGLPLMNNPALRRFFQAFLRGQKGAGLSSVLAYADVHYAEEIQRQADLCFRFDLSKGEAQRGLCFKAFNILLKQAMPGGSSIGLARKWFARYAGDAHRMFQDC